MKLYNLQSLNTPVKRVSIAKKNARKVNTSLITKLQKKTIAVEINDSYLIDKCQINSIEDTIRECHPEVMNLIRNSKNNTFKVECDKLTVLLDNKTTVTIENRATPNKNRFKIKHYTIKTPSSKKVLKITI